MWKFKSFTRNTRRSLSLFLSLLLLVLPASLCFADRVITEPQYQRLLEIVNRQESISRELENSLSLSNNDLNKVKEELTTCKTQLAQVKNELKTSLQETKEARSLLQKALDCQTKLEASLRAYQAQTKKVTRQRNAWEVVCGVLVAGLLVRR